MADNSPYQKSKQSGKWIPVKPHYMLSIILLFSVWFIAVLFTSDSQRFFLIPHPRDVFLRLIRMFQTGNLLLHISITVLEMSLGLFFGAVFAVVLGYAVSHSSLIAYLLEPVIVLSQAIPIVALAPLLTVWFGPGLVSKVVVCGLIVFFPILVNVVNGLQNIDPQHRALFALLEASRRQILLHLEIPAALPVFLAGIKVGSTLAGMGAVVGEFVASTKGLGYLVKQGQNLYDLPMMFAAIFILMGITIFVYFMMSYIERRLLCWKS